MTNPKWTRKLETPTPNAEKKEEKKNKEKKKTREKCMLLH